LYQEYKDVLYGMARRYTKTSTDAEDVLMESFVKIFKSIDKYEGKGSFEGWMKRIVTFTAIDFYRKKEQKDLGLSENEEFEIDETIESTVVEELEAQEIILLMNELPNGYRMILNMYAIEGYSHKEIAKELGISEGTSKSQLSKARKLFATLLNERGIERA